MLRTIRGGLVIGLALAVAVAAGAIIYERYDRRTLNAGIASLLAEGRSWSFIQDMTGCSRATVAKISKRTAAA